MEGIRVCIVTPVLKGWKLGGFIIYRETRRELEVVEGVVVIFKIRYATIGHSESQNDERGDDIRVGFFPPKTANIDCDKVKQLKNKQENKGLKADEANEFPFRDQTLVRVDILLSIPSCPHISCQRHAVLLAISCNLL